MIPVLLTLLSIAGAIGLITFVLLPLRERTTSDRAMSNTRSAPVVNVEIAQLRDEREAALAGLAELDFDRSLGNLTEDDYRQLRIKYRAQAIGILKSLDARSPGQISSKGSLPRPSAGPLLSTDATLSERRARRESGPRTTIVSTTPTPTTAPLNRRTIVLVLGALTAAIFATAISITWLRGATNPMSSLEDAPALDIVHAHAILLVPNSNVTLVAHHNGLLRSTDDGLSWLPVARVTGDIRSLAGSQTSGGSEEPQGSEIYLATGDKVMVSQDDGATWHPIETSPLSGGRVDALAVGDGKPVRLYAYVDGSGLYGTTDLQTWEHEANEPLANVASMSLQPGTFAALYAASPNEGVLATGDTGRTWGSANGTLNGALPTLAVRALTFDGESGDQFSGPDGTQLTGVMYAGTDLGLFKTIDGGSSWSAMPLRVSLVAISSRYSPISPKPLLMAVDSRSRVWRSTDKGSSWDIAKNSGTDNTKSANP